MFIFWVITAACTTSQRGRPDKVIANGKMDCITLINLLDRRAGIYYNGHPEGLKNIYIEPKDSLITPCNNKQFVFQPNHNQNFYIVYPGDRLKIEEDSTGNYIIKTCDNNIIRDNELDLMRQANRQLKNSYGDIIKLVNLRKHTDDAFDKYLQNITGFVEVYKQKHKISEGYEKDLKNYLKYSITGFKLGAAFIAKSAINNSFERHLDSIFAQPDHINARDQYFISLCYMYIGYKTLAKSGNIDIDKIDKDVMYMTADTMLKDTSLRNAVLLSIVKSKIIQAGLEKSMPLVKRFLDNCKDETYLNYLRKTVLQDKILAQINKDSILGFDLMPRDLATILKANTDKLIFIDCWASWCPPCRAEMPMERKLETQYHGKGIIFMYLSIDEHIDDWKAACIKEQLDKKIYNYLIGHKHASSFVQKFKVSNIPRYILIGKGGKIITANAPRPSDKALQTLIEAHL